MNRSLQSSNDPAGKIRVTVHQIIVLARASKAGILPAGSLLCQLGKFYELNLPAVNINSCQSRRPRVSLLVL